MLLIVEVALLLLYCVTMEKKEGDGRRRKQSYKVIHDTLVLSFIIR